MERPVKVQPVKMQGHLEAAPSGGARAQQGVLEGYMPSLCSTPEPRGTSLEELTAGAHAVPETQLEDA